MTPEIVVRSLDLNDDVLAQLAALLPEPERAQGWKYYHARDRRRFIARRGLLRRLLAERLLCHPQEIAFEQNPFGKPSVPGCGLRFNLSYSRGMGLFVFTEGHEIGCDIEWRDSRYATRAVADHFFTACERTALDALAGENWVAGFYDCWTRKEAFLKARGGGLSLPLDDFDVSLAFAEPPRFLRGGLGWTLHAWTLGEFHLAIALED